MTRRLYFSDAWLTRFEAAVERVREKDGLWLALNQTAFYPEGGGQPHDTGTLIWEGGSLQVVNVQADPDGTIWHQAQACPERRIAPGTRVTGDIHWERRFDHMQQHTGEHILAYCVAKLAQGFTHGLHIGHETSSIDVTLPGGATRVEQDMLDRMEDMANRLVQQCLDIACTFPDAEQMAALPLRKDPTVTENIRVCSIGNVEAVACGGTHLSNSGQVGLVKILRCQPARGKMRLFFLCGMRAIRHYAAAYQALDQSATLLNCKENQVAGRVEGLLSELKDSRQEAFALRKDALLSRVPGMLEGAKALSDGHRLVRATLKEEEASMLEEAARALIENPGVIALLAAPRGDSHLYVFARAADAEQDMSRLLRDSDARGGGRPDFARGQGDMEVMEKAVAAVTGRNMK